MHHINKICPKCGSPMADTQIVCNNCGNNLNGGYSNIPNQYIPPVQNNSQKREKDIILYVIIAILVVLLTVIVVMAYSIANKDTKTVTQIIERPAQTTTTTSTDQKNEVQYIVVDEDEYLYPSDRQLITTAYLSTLPKDTVALIRNEIYARHGYIFNNQDYQNYFSSKSWYYPNPYFDESMFNSIEKTNKETIVKYEQSRGWR